ncbi:hypothetical protein AGMMS50229_16990 [Campylobacterota bacterium]|nr:hypothetical protein AGMMS50229_16990 [Campylobacterota bacterium]
MELIIIATIGILLVTAVVIFAIAFLIIKVKRLFTTRAIEKTNLHYLVYSN